MTTTTRIPAPGRGWAYTGATLGGLVSIAANVAHSFIPPAGAPAAWRPEIGAVVGAIVWPVFLFVAIEILARTRWPHGFGWHLLRWAGLVPVAAVAAFVSYRHLSGLLAHYGEEPIVYYLGPLAVDGLMVMATGALMAAGRYPTPILAAVPAGTAGPATPTRTVSTKDTQPTNPTPTPAPVAVPTVTAVPAKTPAETSAAIAPEVPTPAQVATRITPPQPTTPPAPPAAAPVRTARPPSRTNKPATTATTLAPSTADHKVTESDAAQLALPLAPDLLAEAARVAKQYRREHGVPITRGQLAVRLKVTSEEAAQALALLDLNPNNPTGSTAAVNGNRPKGTTR